MVSFLSNIGIRGLFGMLVIIAAMSAAAGIISLQERAEIMNAQERSLQQLLDHRHISDEHINATNATLDAIENTLEIQHQTAIRFDAHINVTEENREKIDEILERIERLEAVRGTDVN